ncbi:MAG TPA: hypothetical protein VEF04_17295 [Blastocatellia bacterium]|nr:hypothetical protein [Blastocatellia bacterium]
MGTYKEMIDEKDIRIDVYRCAAAHCPCRPRMSMTHVPTGTYVSGVDASQIKLRERLLKELEDKISENREK